MDFLRIRQRARERAAIAIAPAPTDAPAPPPVPVPVPALQPLQAPAPDVAAAAPALGPADLERIEDALRAELAATRTAVFQATPPPAPAAEAVRAAPPSAPARRPAAPPAPAPGPRAAPARPSDPLDAFFWHEDEVAPGVLALADPVAPRAPEAPEARSEWLTFALGAEDYGIPITHVREILKAPAITEVPRAPAHVLGIIMVRGEVIAVFDPRRRLGLPDAAPGPRARVVVCDVGEGPRGLLVDGVWHVIRLPASMVEARPAGIGGAAAEYISGLARDRDRLYVLLDLPALLGDGGPARAEATR